LCAFAQSDGLADKALRRGDVLMLAPPGSQDLGSRKWEVAQLGEAAQALVLLYRELLRLCAAERGLLVDQEPKRPPAPMWTGLPAIKSV